MVVVEPSFPGFGWGPRAGMKKGRGGENHVPPTWSDRGWGWVLGCWVLNWRWCTRKRSSFFLVLCYRGGGERKFPPTQPLYTKTPTKRVFATFSLMGRGEERALQEIKTLKRHTTVFVSFSYFSYDRSGGGGGGGYAPGGKVGAGEGGKSPILTGISLITYAPSIYRGRVWGVKPPIHFHCVLHTKRGEGDPDCL